jgi:hypothetical protein
MPSPAAVLEFLGRELAGAVVPLALAAGGGEGVGVMRRAPGGLQVVRGLVGAGVVGLRWQRGSFRLGRLAAQGEASEAQLSRASSWKGSWCTTPAPMVAAQPVVTHPIAP